MVNRTAATRIGVRMAFALAIPLLSSCILVSIADDQNALTNGSFEDGAFVPVRRGVMSLPNGSTAMLGWTVIDNTGQDVAWMQNANDYVQNAATEGTHFVDLTGISDKADANGHFGVLAQAFQTLPGALYEVSLDIGVSNPDHKGPISVKVEISNTSNGGKYYEATCGPFNPEAPGVQWMKPKCTFRFDAASDNTTLKIYGELGTNYIGVDNVKVECVAPLGRHAWCGTVH
jgi:hypothetical protein